MNRWDVIVIMGFLVLALGAGMIYLPAGLIVAGFGAIVVGVVGAMTDAYAHQAGRQGGPR